MLEGWKEVPSNSTAQLCAIKYCRPESILDSTSCKAILLVVKDSAGLKLYVHHALKQRVSETDIKYVEDLLEDLLQRSKQYPEDVFQQLSNLSVGPLVADAVERIDLSDKTTEMLYPDYLLCTS